MALSPQVGEALPPLELDCSPAAMVRYAAGSGDFYALHHDPDAPETRACGQRLVPGRLKHAALGRLVWEWLAHRGSVRRLQCRYVGSDAVGARLVCGGRVAGVVHGPSGTRLRLRLWIRDPAGRPTTTGEADVDWCGP